MARAPDVAIIGGGYAGMAAAVELTASGVAVTVYEANSVLGGRARRIEYRGRQFDNGQHLILGAYRTLLHLIERVAPARSAFVRTRFDYRHGDALALRARSLPAPLDMAGALLMARGLSLQQRWAAMRFVARLRHSEPKAGETVTEWLAREKQHGAMAKRFWEPLCTATLNTRSHEASARLFRNVLEAALLGGRGASDLLFARMDLSALFPEPARAYVEKRGGRVVGTAIKAIEYDDNRYTLRGATVNAIHDFVIIATAPHQARRLLRFDALQRFAEFCAALKHEPIYTAYFEYAHTRRLPSAMIGLDGSAQWLFDRCAIGLDGPQLAAVISAHGAHEQLSRDALLTAIAGEIDQRFGFGKPDFQALVIEKQATFSARPELPRPPSQTEMPRLYLAGDYTEGPYPATLEAAVNSGVRCAQLILKEFGNAE